jgi:hypothetical protein
MSKRPGIKLKVASPCPAKWDDMKGDDAVRHCDSCNKDVFQISNMSTEQVERFLLARKGLRTCVRFYQRADGTLLTGDCSVGKKAKRKKKVLSAATAAAIGAGALGLSYGLSPDAPQSKAKPACHIDSAPSPATKITPEPKVDPKPVQGEIPVQTEYVELLGDIAYEPDEDIGEELGELATE